ncbi:MAG: hypothetical protein AAFR65_16580 [Pseudomonadota bacterium]
MLQQRVPEEFLGVSVGIVSSVIGMMVGSPLVAALAGSILAARYRMRRPSSAPPRRWYWFWFVLQSLFFGLLAGPYLASQFPEGEGSLQLFVFVASFMAAGFLEKLDGLDWDVVTALSSLFSSFTNKRRH